MECAQEGGVVHRGGLVRFGIENKWVEASLPEGASCDMAAFGDDPFPYRRKVCLCSRDPIAMTDQRRTELGVRWRKCAEEGQYCHCSTGTVRFGAGNRWWVSELTEQPLPATIEAPARRDSTEYQCVASTFQKEDPYQRTTKECWCREDTKRRDPAKVGIVLLSRRPADIKTWLLYHLDFMGIDHIFIQVEDTPDFDPIFKSMSRRHQSQVTVWHVNAGTEQDRRPRDDYEMLQQRQMHAMQRAYDQAEQMGLNWLIHIDDDELLYTPMHRSVGDVLASMPTHYDEAYMPNFEAVYPSADVHNCFTETSVVNMNIYSFVSYANGKAAVRVQYNGAKPWGPHMWRSASGQDLPAIHLDKEPFGAPLMVLHYESCPFSRWEVKYWELANTNPEKLLNIPFPFYRDSISLMHTCASSDKERDGAVLPQRGPQCANESLKHFWESWKTGQNPRIKSEDLMPINIPWTKIRGPSL